MTEGVTTWFRALGSEGGLQALLAERGPRLATAVLLAGLAVEAGILLTRDLGESGALPPAAPVHNAPERHTVDLRAIVDAHLFGQAAVSATEAPQTSIPLVLAGVLALQDPSQGMAILGPNPAQAKLYAVGAAVPGGARLHAVYRDRVLLDRGGTLESLTLPRKSLVAAPPPRASSPTPGQRLQALAQTSGALLGGLIRAQAVLQQGALQGYRIFPGVRSDPAGFAQLGLRAGDLITAVNGTPLDDPGRSLEILQTLSAASSAEVTIVRQGVQQDISLNLAAVASHAERAASESAAGAEESASPPSDAAAVGNRPQVEH